MSELERLGLNAQAWRFLSRPDNYVEASRNTGRPLVPASTARQFKTVRDILVRLNGSNCIPARKGVLLADDVGLGKTTVGALVAWIVARAGDAAANVRILAPNDTMRRRWQKELASHVPMLRKCAEHLKADTGQLRDRQTGKLRGGRIQVATHFHAAEKTVACDLLIIDEAHRAKGEHSKFAKAIRAKQKSAKRILILTATPFSIDITELARTLLLVGAEKTDIKHVKLYAETLNRLFTRGIGHDIGKESDRLAARAEAAVSAIRPYMIRHGIDDLPYERAAFGEREDWSISVPSATHDELELVLRADRLLQLFSDEGRKSTDARFHVGRFHLTDQLDKVERACRDEPKHVNHLVLQHHVNTMKALHRRLGSHPKVEAVAKAVADTARAGEKVVVFCHHHATAQEFVVELSRLVPLRKVAPQSMAQTWKSAWADALWEPASDAKLPKNFNQLRDTFIEWLCSIQIRSQVLSWLPAGSESSVASLIHALQSSAVRHCKKAPPVASAASELLKSLTDPESRSTLGVLRAASTNPQVLPGYCDPLIATCIAPAKAPERRLFLGNQQPDTLLHIFNSPFGPDVLVATDAFSEGIDLHRYCRHLVHFELDPSPIRTVQRNGRLRRVGSWSSLTDQPIRYAFPAFGGTRDQKQVQIMKKRVDTFALLLGGVHSFDVEMEASADDTWRHSVIAEVDSRLHEQNRKLVACSPGEFESPDHGR